MHFYHLKFELHPPYKLAYERAKKKKKKSKTNF